MVFNTLSSDQMGNKGAFITMTDDLKPKFTTYDAVVSYFVEKKALSPPPTK